MYSNFHYYLLIFCNVLVFVDPSFWPSSMLSKVSYFIWNCDLLNPNEIMHGLEKNVSQNMFGQHLLLHSVLEPLRQHLYNPNPRKALVLSFQGPPGVGKNYLASMIGHHMFQRGFRSPNVIMKVGSHDYSNPKHLESYSNELKNLIKTSTQHCGRSLFIFDEADKVPNSLFNVLRPFLDHIEQYDGVDFRKTTFIIITNIGSKSIVDVAYDHVKQGGSRESLELFDFRAKLQHENYNSDGGYRTSNVIANHLVDYFIPFLPLEKEHVIRCINAAAKEQGIVVTEELRTYILDRLSWVPYNDGVFSSSGCKGVHSALVAIHSYRGIRKRVKDEF